MIDRFRTHMQAMQTLQRAQEITANNLANINTAGFKSGKMFQTMLTEEIDGEMVTTVNTGSRPVMTQGVFEQTGNDFDFAINGRGFFVVEEGGREFLTRSGRFTLDGNGSLRNERGGQVMGQDGPITLPELNQAIGENRPVKFEVGTDGTIRVNDRIRDRIRIVEPDNIDRLQRHAGMLFFADEEHVVLNDDERSTILQGYFEKSNVNTLEEMVDMMQTMQMFESAQRALRTADEMLSQATNKLGQY